MGIAVEVINLNKNFGEVQALQGCSFTIMEKEIFGLIGPNGAGKTTALRILSTLLTADGGTARIFDNDIRKNPETIREIISYLPEDAGAYQYLTGMEYLNFMAGIYARNRDEALVMIDEAKKISGLGERLRDRIKGYSRGMSRRLLLARALMMKPRLAILDEPTSGLDVIQAHHVRKMIMDYSEGQGVTVLISSHNMLEVEFLCHKVALINEGTVVAEGSPRELKETFGARNLEEAFMEAAQLG